MRTGFSFASEAMLGCEDFLDIKIQCHQGIYEVYLLEYASGMIGNDGDFFMLNEIDFLLNQDFGAVLYLRGIL